MQLARRQCLLCLGSAAAALAGCSASGPGARGRTGPLVWPPPPELPRYLHEATLRHTASVQGDAAEGQLRRLLTGEQAAQPALHKPLAVAAQQGRVYVTDTEARRVFVFDAARRRTFAFGLRREGELKRPTGVAVDAQGRVHVLDATARRLVRYDAFGLFEAAIDIAADVARPAAVACDATGQTLYVVDTGGVESEQHRIVVYAQDGRRLDIWGRRGAADGEFNLPTDACIGPGGTVWVLDAGNFRVQAFDAQGRFLRSFGSLGTGIGQFARPRGLAVAPDGRVYVSDAAFCNVQVFTPQGELLLALGARAEGGDAPGRYLLPARLAVDETGRLYVVDQFLRKVEVIRALSPAEGRRLQTLTD